MKQSATQLAIFRELSGEEMATVIAHDLVKSIIGTLRQSGRFERGDAYPVVKLSGKLAVKILPGEKLPEPFLVELDVVLPGQVEFDEAESSGCVAILAGEIEYGREVGMTTQTAPDRVREEVGLTVLQPQKDKQGRVRNMPVEKERKA